MVQQSGPAVGEVQDGYRFKGGNPSNPDSWEQVGEIDVSAEYGAGARQTPSGRVYRVGPRGGQYELGHVNEDGDTAPKLTEGQGKSVLYGGMMAGAERDYQAAREAGYDPASIRNQLARGAGVIPFDGDFFGRLIRDDVSDRGNQAELRWAEGNLRQLTGAAATNPEIARVAAINFDRGNDELADQRYRTRAETYQGTRYAAGPGSAALPAYPGAPGGIDAGPVDPATGLPTYPGLTRTNAADAPLPPGGLGGGPSGPGSAPDTAIDVTNREALLSAGPGAYVRFPDGSVERLSSAPIVGEATGQEVSPGVFAQAVTPAQAVAARREDEGIGRRVDTAVRGAADALTFGLSDEITAGLNTVAPLDRGTRGGWNGDWEGAYRQNLDLMRSIDELDAEQMPLTRGAGQVAGALAGGIGAARAAPAILRNAPRVAGATGRQVAGRIAGNTARQAAIGAAGAGAYGLGSAEGNVLERLPEAGQSAVLGGVLGPVVSKVGESVLSPAAGAIGRAVGLAPRRSALEGAVSRFGSRYNPNPNVLSQQVDDLEALGIQPAFVDVMDRGQRGLGRALAMRQTPAREAVSEFAENRAESLPDRLSRQARRTISNDPRSPMEIREAVGQEGRRQAAPLYEQAYAQPVEVTPVIQDLLRRPAGQAALQRAQRIAANEGQSIDMQNPSMQTLDYVKRGLDDVLEGYRDRTTGRMVLDTEGRAIEGVRRDFLGELDNINPAYRQARQSYADMSRLQEATDLGEGFLTTEADEFAARAGRLTPEQRPLAQAAARRAVERGASTQGNAPGIAQRLSSGREQGMRNQALLGEGAIPMQNAMGAERRMVMNARDINPGAGSPTAQNQMDLMETGGNILSAGASALTGNVRGTVGSLARLARLGYSDREAEAIMTAAIDPTQTRSLINMFAERGLSKEKARNLTRALRFYASQRSGDMAAGDAQ